MPALPRRPDPLPVLVLTGFLGSGKTTLLNRLLRAWPRTALIINEFGAAPIDQRLVEDQGTPLLALAGGCLCCQVRGALAPMLRNLRLGWERGGGADFERVIIETSGIASPEPVLDALLRDRWLAARYRLEAVVATVAAPAALDALDRHPEAEAQVAWADVVVMTQTDLADTATVAALEARLEKLAPAAARLRAIRGELDPAALTARPGFRPRPAGSALPEHSFTSRSVLLPEPLPWPVLRDVLARLLAGHPELVRLKGVVYLPGETHPVAVHGAGGRLFPPTPLPPRAADDGRGRLVVITAGPSETLAAELNAAFGKG